MTTLSNLNRSARQLTDWHCPNCRQCPLIHGATAKHAISVQNEQLRLCMPDPQTCQIASVRVSAHTVPRRWCVLVACAARPMIDAAFRSGLSCNPCFRSPGLAPSGSEVYTTRTLLPRCLQMKTSGLEPCRGQDRLTSLNTNAERQAASHRGKCFLKTAPP